MAVTLWRSHCRGKRYDNEASTTINREVGKSGGLRRNESGTVPQLCSSSLLQSEPVSQNAIRDFVLLSCVAWESIMPQIKPFISVAQLDLATPAPELNPLPYPRPVLLIGHGSRSAQGRQNVLDFAAAYQAMDTSRPVVPCFLELTEPTIQQGVDACVAQGYTDLSALPVLLFAARHNKFDVTNELDRARERHPQVTFHYGRHFGITPTILELWQSRLAQLDTPAWNPHRISRADTVLMVVGRGSSDPDANGDLCKLARLLWEGSDYGTVETCFVGITHPRIEQGFQRSLLHKPKRIIMLPYFLFAGVLMDKIADMATQQQAEHPEVQIQCLPEMGIHPQLFHIMRSREIETQLGQVQMNCEMCKFRLAASDAVDSGNHSHGSHDHSHHGHGHGHDGHGMHDPYATPTQYHNRIWQTP